MDLSKFSFGATSAIITSLALIVGLNESLNPKMSIIGALLVLAFADNIADSLGVHVYRESECSKPTKNVKVGTFTNFITRMLITSTFVLIVLFFPMNYATIISVVFGICILSLMSYSIALSQKTSPYKVIFEHVGIALVVIIASHFVGRIITNMLGKI